MAGNLLAWSRMVDPAFRFPKHIRFIADALMRVERGEIDRLMIETPPRHGKTLLTSVHFPAWYLGRNPDDRIIQASYSASLAQTISRKSRNSFAEWGPKVFDCDLATDSASVGLWQLQGKEGGLLAVGVGGAATGHGASLLQIDDPLRNAQDANSKIIRERLWEWYQSVALTRLHPGGRVVIINTRWHQSDLCGVLLAQEPERWHRIRLPAIAEENDPLGRKPGEALWPQRYPVEALMKIKKQVGPTVWNALYQQNPTDPKGGIIRIKYFNTYDTLPERPQPADFIQSWDCAFKGEASSSYVVGQVWCRVGADFYLVDQFRKQATFTETINAMLVMMRRYPQALPILIEDKANGPAIIDALRTKIAGLKPVLPSGSKEARAHAVLPYIEGGNVYLPRRGWLDELLEELAAFPKAPHDDQVDALTQGLGYYRRQTPNTTIELDLGLERESNWRF